MQIYLPIADLPVNIFLILAMGLAVGFISGMFGIGGGFLMTPLLIFVGIAPAVAVASVASHIAASSFTGALTYWRRRALDRCRRGRHNPRLPLDPCPVPAPIAWPASIRGAAWCWSATNTSTNGHAPPSLTATQIAST